MAFVTLGTFMLWFGWFGFNNGSVYMYVNGNPAPSPGSLAGAISAEVVQRTSMNTALGGAAAGLTSLLCAALLWGERSASL
jgi:Amt family ammonium transporter